MRLAVAAAGGPAQARTRSIAQALQALSEGEVVTTTGLVYQELLQGFHGPRGQQAIVAQLCIRYELRLLSTDEDFGRIAEVEPLERWLP